MSMMLVLVLQASAPAIVEDTEQAPPASGDEETIRPVYDPEAEWSAKWPGKFRYRGTSFGFGGRFISIWPGCTTSGECTGSPYVGIRTLAGWRRARVFVGIHTAPVPVIDYDVVLLDGFMVQLGFLFGNENIRAGISGRAGISNISGDVHIVATPWRTCRGGRHGIELAAGFGYVFTATLAYRWAPGALNHRGSRHAGWRHSSVVENRCWRQRHG